MALWGKADDLFSPGTVTVDFAAKTVIGTGTSFRSAGISTGTIITIAKGNPTKGGYAVISGVTSERLVSIATTQYLLNALILSQSYTLSQEPIYTLEDSNYAEKQTTSPKLTNNIYGVDEYEQAVSVATSSIYKSAHAGWVGIHTYVDMHGNLRVKTEVLVAMSGISSGTASYTSSGDADDDAVYPDS